MHPGAIYSEFTRHRGMAFRGKARMPGQLPAHRQSHGMARIPLSSRRKLMLNDIKDDGKAHTLPPYGPFFI